MASPKKRTSARKKTPSKPKPSVAAKKQASAKSLTSFVSATATNRTFIRNAGIFVVVLAVILAGILWYFKVYTDPQRMFWGMIDNNLSTRSVTKELDQTANSVTTNELIQMNFVPSPIIRDVKKIIDSSADSPTTIILEAVGTAEADYQHYLLIDRPAAEGQAKTDYSSIYDKWVKSGGEPPFGGAQLANNSLFGPLLFGYLPQPSRQAVIDQLRKAYQVDYASVERLSFEGRQAYSFNVDIALQQYAEAAQQYARSLGLPIAEQIQPSNYEDSAKTSVNIVVDALSRQVRQIIYMSNNSSETYSSYGALPRVQIPTETVSSQQFQEAVNRISQ